MFVDESPLSSLLRLHRRHSFGKPACAAEHGRNCKCAVFVDVAPLAFYLDWRQSIGREIPHAIKARWNDKFAGFIYISPMLSHMNTRETITKEHTRCIESRRHCKRSFCIDESIFAAAIYERAAILKCPCPVEFRRNNYPAVRIDKSVLPSPPDAQERIRLTNCRLS